MTFDDLRALTTKQMAEFDDLEGLDKLLAESSRARAEVILRLLNYASEVEKVNFQLLTEKRASEIVACSMQQLYARDAASHSSKEAK